jgi:hypothetical protein
MNQRFSNLKIGGIRDLSPDLINIGVWSENSVGRVDVHIKGKFSAHDCDTKTLSILIKR